MTKIRAFWARFLAAASVAAGFTFIGVVPASAHHAVTEQTPMDQENLQQSPEEIALTFNVELLDVEPTMMVLDAEGQGIEVEPAEVEANVLSQEIEGNLSDGHYEVRWQVLSGDGRPMSSRFTFSVGDVEGLPEIPEPDFDDDDRGPVIHDNLEAGVDDSVEDRADGGAESGGSDTGRYVRAGSIGALGALVLGGLWWGVRHRGLSRGRARALGPEQTQPVDERGPVQEASKPAREARTEDD